MKLGCFLATCDHPVGDNVSNELSEVDVNALRMECYYANPATDRAAILSVIAKTAPSTVLMLYICLFVVDRVTTRTLYGLHNSVSSSTAQFLLPISAKTAFLLVAIQFGRRLQSTDLTFSQ